MKEDNLKEQARHQALSGSLVFIELKKEVADRLELPVNVPIFKRDYQEEVKSGQIPPSALAAGIEALKMIKPDLTIYDRFLARYYLMEGQHGLEHEHLDEYEAQRYFQKAIDLDVGDLSAEAAYYQATLLSEVDKAEAEKLLRFSDELNPEVPSVHFELALLLRERRDLTGAMEEFEKAYKLQPDNANLLNEIGETHLMVEDLPKARAAFSRAFELEPEHWILPIKLGLTEYRLEDYAQAIVHLRAGLDLSPDEFEGEYYTSFYIEGLYYLGLSYRAINDLVRARKLFKAVLNVAPDHQGALEAL